MVNLGGYYSDKYVINYNYKEYKKVNQAINKEQWLDPLVDEYNRTYYRQKKWGYFSLSMLTLCMLLLLAIPNMYETDKGDIINFNYGQRIVNIIVPRQRYYSNSSNNMNPITLSIIWYCFAITSLLGICGICKMKPT